MLLIDKTGRVIDRRVKQAISPLIERGELSVIHGIVIHQTASATASATMNGYQLPKANGAHFLIDKDGTIYQTASLYKRTYHVGYIKSRCIAEKSCTPVDLKALQGKKVGAGIGRVEVRKPYPKRYPFNDDSIGIENVSMAINGVFEPLTVEQQTALTWLVRELVQTLRLSRADVFRHSEVSWKLESEGASATW